ncbi:MAG: ParD-like family protein [Bdellovibrio sp.]|nr:ParD-like family protein [Bdellovibrio sp.]
MGIVKISDELHDELRKASQVFDRSLNSQAEHWIKIGMLAELHPSINYEEIRNLLLTYPDLSIEKIIKKVRIK